MGDEPELVSESLFEAMKPFLETNGAKLVSSVNAIFHFEIRKAKGAKPVHFTLNLKSGNGSIEKGLEGEPDATFMMLDDDFVKLASRELNPQVAFMQGKLKIKGNLTTAMKFAPDAILSKL
jgi:3-hydroxyacyl-CoA dehydrogenase/3a,7a,12a-trihydroxy-5b-cholest-24-enoyl-CoA hydratase